MTAPLGPKGASVVDGVDLAGIGRGLSRPLDSGRLQWCWPVLSGSLVFD